MGHTGPATGLFYLLVVVVVEVVVVVAVVVGKVAYYGEVS